MLRQSSYARRMTGTYTFVNCLCERIRLKEDGINRAVAGCSSGLAIGWKNGPASAAQSCAFIGAVSYFLDVGPTHNTPPAAAAAGPRASSSCCSVGLGQHQQQGSAGGQAGGSKSGHGSDMMRQPAPRRAPRLRPSPPCQGGVAWLEPIFRTAYFAPPALALTPSS